MHLSVLTLNCWGVHTPLACEKRKERMAAIAKELLKGEHDIIALQELWSSYDAVDMEETLSKVYPYHHRWHSQLIGSGLAIFSKWPIVDTSYLKYTLNAHAHCIHHGDWWGGKGAGLARIACNEFRVNVYVTHLLAQYHHPHDEYHGHRVAQVFQLAHFVRTTSETCDAVVVAGDLNSRPDSVAFQLLVNHAMLRDAWVDQKVKPVDPGYTSNVPSNSFLAKYWVEHFPEGERLDYILYRNNQGCTMDCDECRLTMQKIPGEKYNYSDHEGVCAKFHLRRNPTAMPPELCLPTMEMAVANAIHSLEVGKKRIIPETIFFAVAAFIALVGYCLLDLDALSIPFLTEIIRFGLTFIFWYCFTHALLAKRFEWNGYVDFIKQLNKVQTSMLKKS